MPVGPHAAQSNTQQVATSGHSAGGDPRVSSSTPAAGSWSVTSSSRSRADSWSRFPTSTWWTSAGIRPRPGTVTGF